MTMITDSGVADQVDVEAVVNERIERLLVSHPPATTERVSLLGAQFDLGLAWVRFPVGYGGLGLPPHLQNEIDARLRAAGVPAARETNGIGYGMAAPTIVAYGGEALMQRHLRPIFTSEDIWCQLFSEPGAGSDVAGLSTLAVRDGDEWSVTGQKVWTTRAHVARWGLLLARTDPAQPKHKGLTYFILNMNQAGVDPRPLRQMTGDAEFNEVFLNDARIPDSQRLGAVGEGWSVAVTTLMNERVSIGRLAARGSALIDVALGLWWDRRPASRVLRDRLVRAWIEAEVLRLNELRAGENRRNPGPEGSLGKLFTALHRMKLNNLMVDLLGADAMLYDYTRPLDDDRASTHDVVHGFLRSRANSIEGGTSEVMRNILGERVLGLPPGVRVDRDRPWRDVPRS